MKRRSRLNRTTSEKTKKQILFLLVSIIVTLILLIQLGPIALSTVGSFVTSFQGSKDKVESNDNAILEVPFIESIPDATDSGEITVKGSAAYSDAQIELYVNGRKYDLVFLDSKQKFTFSDVKLREGENLIKARVKKANSTSHFTREYKVIYSKRDANLEVFFPFENQDFSKGDQSIQVQGKTDPENTVTVNGFKAIVESEGVFSYYLNLVDGENYIKIEAITPSGTSTIKEIKVTYTP